MVNFWRSVIIEELWRPEIATRQKFWDFFLRFLVKRPLTVKFSKFFSESFHRDTDRRVVFKFREIWPTENRWNRALITWQIKKFAWLSGCRYCADRGQPPTMHLECSRFYPNRFTFCGVIAERVNTAKTRCKLNPTFGWSLASSRIIIKAFIPAMGPETQRRW